MKIHKLMEFFAGAGWHVVEAKYGRLLQDGVRPAGRRRPARATSTTCRTRSTSRCSRIRGAELRERFLAGADADVAAVRSPTCPTTTWRRWSRTSAATTSAAARRGLPRLRRRDRPPERRVRLHGQGLGPADRRRPAQPRRAAVAGADRRAAGRGRAHRRRPSGTASPPDSPEGRLCAAVGGELNNRPVPPRPGAADPDRASAPLTSQGRSSTQEAFGRLLTGARRPSRGRRRDSSRRRPTSASRPTSAAGSTRWACSAPRRSATSSATERLLRWRQAPAGHHIELGISEMNLFLTAARARPRPRAARRAPAARSAPSTTRSSAAASTP